MRFNGRATTDAQELAALVTADGATSGFVKDSEVSTFARTYLDDTDSRAVAATIGLWKPLAGSAVAVTHTGNTNETALATIAIPAGAMGPNGQLRVWTNWTITNSGNTKTPRIRLGGISGDAFFSAGPTAIASFHDVRRICNRNSQSSQMSSPAGLNGGIGQSGGAIATGTQNTANALDLIISGQLANSGESIVLESYLVELLYGA